MHERHGGGADFRETGSESEGNGGSWSLHNGTRGSSRELPGDRPAPRNVTNHEGPVASDESEATGTERTPSNATQATAKAKEGAAKLTEPLRTVPGTGRLREIGTEVHGPS